MLGRLFQGTDVHPNLMAFLSWAQDEGGLPVLLTRFKNLEEGGITAEKLTPEHIRHLFSADELSSLAQRMNISQEDVTEWISGHLPTVFHHLSPEANQLGGNNMLDVALSILRKWLK
jgi:uncharacterized protein YidB (DUF937 family)